MFWLIDWLSCWARLAMIVISTSPFASSVLMASFSKYTGMFLSFSCRMYCRQSRVFLANRLMDLVMIMSIFPAMHSSIIRLNSSRFFVLVPEMPFRILLNVLGVVCDLSLVACFLFFGIRADAAVGCNTELFLSWLFYCISDLPSGRNHHNISH